MKVIVNGACGRMGQVVMRLVSEGYRGASLCGGVDAFSTLPEIVKNAAAPLAQTDKIVMYGDGNSTKMVKDVMNSANQIFEGVKESTGIDLQSMLTGFMAGKVLNNTSDSTTPAERE